MEKFQYRNGQTLAPYQGQDGYYWIDGSAIIREKMYPYDRNQRINFHTEREGEQMPILISNGMIDMNNDVFIPVEWVTARSRFWGPVILIPPWKEK